MQSTTPTLKFVRIVLIVEPLPGNRYWSKFEVRYGGRHVWGMLFKRGNRRSRSTAWSACINYVRTNEDGYALAPEQLTQHEVCKGVPV